MINKYFNKLLMLNRNSKILIQIIFDCFLICTSFSFSMLLRLDSFSFIKNPDFLLCLIILIPVTIILYIFFEVYLNIVRHVNEKIYSQLGKAIFFSSLIILILSQILTLEIPRSVPLINIILLFCLSSGVRLFLRNSYLAIKLDKRKKVAIYGAGFVGRETLNSISQSLEYLPVLFIDDDKSLNKNNKRIESI